MKGTPNPRFSFLTRSELEEAKLMDAYDAELSRRARDREKESDDERRDRVARDPKRTS